MSIFSEVIAGAAPRRVPVRRPSSGPSESRTAAAITRTPVQRAALGPSLAQRRELYHEMMRERTRQHYAALRAHAVARREAVLRSGRRVGPDAGTVGKVPGLGRVSGRANVGQARGGSGFAVLPSVGASALGGIAHAFGPEGFAGKASTAAAGFVQHQLENTLRNPLGRQLLAASGPIGSAFANAAASGGEEGVKVAGRIIRDAVDLPAQTVAGLAAPAEQVLKGHPGKAAGMFTKPYSELYHHPLKSIEEHPLATGLMVAAPLRGASRLAGGSLRAGVAGRPGKRYASAAPVRRELAPGFVVEKALPRGIVGNRLAKRRLAKPPKARETERAVQSRVDYMVDRAQVAHRRGRVETAKVAGGRVPRTGLKPYQRVQDVRTRRALERTDLGRMILEGRVRPGRVAQDLTRIQARLRTEEPKLRAAGAADKLRVNHETQESIGRALADPKAIALIERRGFEAMRPQAQAVRAQEQRAVRETVLAPQRLKAQYVPALVEHTETRTGKGLRLPTEVGARRAELAAEIAGARKTAGETRQALRQTERRASFAAGRSGALVAQREMQALRGDARYRTAAVAYRQASTKLRAARKSGHRVVEAARARDTAREGFRQERQRVLGTPSLGQRSTPAGLRAHESAGDLREAQMVAGEAKLSVRDAEKAARAYRAETRGRPGAFQPWMVIRDAKGGVRPIGEREAVGLLREKGVDLQSVAFVGERPGMRSASAYARGEVKAKGEGTPSEVRTGQAVLEGAVDVTHQAVLDDAFRRRSIVEAARGSYHLVRSVTFGDFRTKKQAQAFADQMRVGPDGRVNEQMPEMVPIDLAPIMRRAAEIAARREHLGLREQDASLLLKGWQELIESGQTRAPTGPTGAGRWALWPAEAARRLHQHASLQNPTDIWKTTQAISQQFRKTVLLTSTRWLAGNTVEMTFRTVLMHGMNPVDWRTGKRLFRAAERLDPEQASELHAGTTGFGGHMGSLERLGIYRADPAQYGTGPVRDVVRAWQATFGSKPIRMTFGNVWRGYSAVIRGFNTWVEHQGDIAIMGRLARRDWRDFSGSWHRAIHLSEGAYEDLARGLFATERQERYAREIDKIRGQYSRFGPGMRDTIIRYAPFLPWYVNALKFVYLTLPKDHPVKAGVLAGLIVGQEQQLTQDGQFIFGRGGLKPFLVGTVPTAAGRVPVSRYLPFGVFSSPPFQQILPQASWISGLGGADWKGEQIKNPDGSSPGMFDLLKYGLYAGIETVVPGLAILRRVRESGQPTATGSTFFAPRTTSGEPDSDLTKGILKVINPFTPYGAAGKKGPLPDNVQKDLERIHGSGSKPVLPQSAQQDLERIYGSK